MYLIDTCTILELLIGGERAKEVEDFLRRTPTDLIHLSDYTLHLLGVLLLKRGKTDLLLQVLGDLVLAGGIRTLRLKVEDLPDLVMASRRFSLDYDDAYHYTLAAKYGLRIVSLDPHLDRTDLGRLSPAEVSPQTVPL